MKQTGITFIFIIVGISLFLSPGCKRYPDDKRLLALSKIVSDSPEEVILSLDSIDKNSLSSRNRHYYDLLWIKARDKAYIIHESDSLILDVINYYKGNTYSGLYAEALYYGGRVYSDLGDNPTALKYFQESLDNLGDSEQDLELKYRLLSQTGRVLAKIHLYEEAVEYIKQSLEIEEKWQDTIKMISELRLIGEVYIQDQKPDKSIKYLEKALALSKNQSASTIAGIQMDLAVAKNIKGDIDSALVLIDGVIDKVDPVSRNTALTYAADIFLSAEKLDSAYKYARELLEREDDITFRIFGFYILLSPEIRGLLPPDSIYDYINEYLYLLETQYDSNSSQLAITTQAKYNYNLHVRSKEKSEKDNIVLRNGLIIFGLIILLLSLIILIMKNRNQANIIKLHHALKVIDTLENSLKEETAGVLEDNIPGKTQNGIEKDNIKDLREKLRAKLLSVSKGNEDKEWRTKEFIDSEAYKKLQTLINGSESIKEQDPFWNVLETTLLKFYPDFKSNLQVLLRGRLSLSELQTSILIKYGVSPNQMAILLNRSKNTIVSRRNTIGLKIFDEKMPPKIIDSIIRIL